MQTPFDGTYDLHLVSKKNNVVVYELIRHIGHLADLYSERHSLQTQCLQLKTYTCCLGSRVLKHTKHSVLNAIGGSYSTVSHKDIRYVGRGFSRNAEMSSMMSFMLSDGNASWYIFTSSHRRSSAIYLFSPNIEQIRRAMN